MTHTQCTHSTTARAIRACETAAAVTDEQRAQWATREAAKQAHAEQLAARVTGDLAELRDHALRNLGRYQGWR